MKRLQLSASKRISGKKNDSKKTIFGVVYGPKTPSQSISVNVLEFQKIFPKAGENTLIDLSMDKGSPMVTLIHDVQYSPTRGFPIHIDFFAVDMKEKVEAAVPLEFAGVSPAVKEEFGVLVRNMEEITVRCLPSDIPKSFTVDLSLLKTFDDCIYVKDIVHNEKYEAMIDGESAVALVVRPRKEEEETISVSAAETTAQSQQSEVSRTTENKK